MADSYAYITNDQGQLLSNIDALSMLDCHHDDVYEALEEMYGMIWYLAYNLADVCSSGGLPPVYVQVGAGHWVESAKREYKEGLKQSPGVEVGS